MKLFKPEDISTLCLGVQGENKSRIIQIDVSDWLKEFPNANINILVTRPTETTPYIANTSVINGIFTWLISDSDTTYSGLGKAELRATKDDIIKKSLTYLTSIKESLEGVPSPLPPEPSESWVNAVIEKANEVLNSRVESFNINEQGHLIATLEDGTTQDLGNVVGSGKVSSVNGQTGDVFLTANDVNAYSKIETDTKLSEKQNVIDSNNKLPYALISDTPTIPTKTSDLTNDSGFITNAVNNLVNYYLKSETYTKTEVDSLISAISTMSLQVVQALPTEDIQTNVIYLVPRSDSETGNIYDEYIYVSNAWEKIGSTDVDLTGYATETWVNTQIAGFLTQSQIEGLINTALTNYYTKSDFVDFSAQDISDLWDEVDI